MITEDFNDQAIREAIEAVDENNNSNVGAWSDWDDAEHIIETYEINGIGEAEAAILDRAIASNGKSLVEDMPAIERT